MSDRNSESIDTRGKSYNSIDSYENLKVFFDFFYIFIFAKFKWG